MKRPTDLSIQRVLNEKSSPREAELVAAWFATDEGHEWLSSAMDADAERIVAGKIPLLDNIPTEELLHRVNRIIDRGHRRTLLFRITAVLIPCALIVAMWINLNSRLGGILFSTPGIEEISARRGERKEIIFQDGSKVWLNAGTHIVYPEHFGIKDRHIHLNGEAYFEIKPNAHRPFIVQLGKAKVRVLGTSFNVRAYDYEPTCDIVLIDGKVEFSNGNQQYVMQPNQKLVYDKTSGKVQLYSEQHADREKLWRENVISFRDVSLRSVIASLEQWYDVRFEVIDDAAYDCTFSLQTQDLPLRELLDEMERISPLSFDIRDDGIIVIGMK